MIQIPEEERKLKSRRQSLMDNREMIFCYSKQGGYAHDKFCPDIKGISDENFMASSVFPEGLSSCPHCRLMMLLREACSPKARQVPALYTIFRRRSVGYKQLKDLIRENGYHFYLNTPGELIVETTEDHWIIKFH